MRIMRFSPLLFSYIASEIFSPFLAAFFITNGILVFGQVIPLFDVIIDLGVSVPNLIRLILYMSPKILLFSLPLASMLGIVLGVSRLAGEGDILTLKAGGVSLYSLLPPVLLLASLNSLLTGYAAAELMPVGEIATKKLLFQMAKEKFDRSIRPRHFSEGTGKIVLYINEIQEKTKQWQGVFISDMRNAEKPVLLMAKKAAIKADSANMVIELQLTDGSIHTGGKDETQTVLFGGYQFYLPLDGPREIAGERAPSIGKHGMKLSSLLREAKKHEKGSEQESTYLIEFHKRLLLPVGGLLLSILALPLGTLARPGRRALGIPLALGIFILYYVFISAAKVVIGSTGFPVGPTLWTANLFLFLAVMALLGMSAADRFLETMDAILTTLISLLRRK